MVRWPKVMKGMKLPDGFKPSALRLSYVIIGIKGKGIVIRPLLMMQSRRYGWCERTRKIGALSLIDLLGDNPDAATLKNLSSEKQVTADTPPVFLWHTGEDTGVVPEHSIAFYQALRKADVPVELHIYERGRHGLGMASSVPTVADWTARCTAWMRSRGLLDRSP